jgi:hypothetical protein
MNEAKPDYEVALNRLTKALGERDGKYGLIPTMQKTFGTHFDGDIILFTNDKETGINTSIKNFKDIIKNSRTSANNEKIKEITADSFNISARMVEDLHKKIEASGNNNEKMHEKADTDDIRDYTRWFMEIISKDLSQQVKYASSFTSKKERTNTVGL